MYTKLLLFILFHSSSAVMYELKDADYALMPPVFQWDDYEECLKDPEGLYCTAEFTAVSDGPSTLLTMMQEYSEHTPTHYNHTLLRRGICITSTCKNHYENSEGDLKSALEACANATLYSKYKLKGRVSDVFACSKREKSQPIDYVELAVGLVCIAILVTNIVASFSDYISENGRDCGGLFLTMVLVISGHTIVSIIYLPEETSLIEKILTAGPFHILTNGTLIMQTFLVIASFLLVYNWLIYSEEHEPLWNMLPKQFMLRWLRLTPSYAIVLALTATWFGRIASGPSWEKGIGNELSDCRRDWWKHLLYINNYVDNSECMVQSWYLAVDTQLYLMAATIFVTCRTARARKVVLSLLFVLGMLVPTLQTYYQNLDGVLIVSPELILNLFRNSPTFNEVYKRGHTNLTGYVIGQAMGYWLYEWQKAGGNSKTFRKYRFLYWTLFPLECLCCYSGTVFYTNSPRPSLFVNLLFAAFMKPIFGILVGTIILGVIIQLEGLYRTILEWPVWTVPSRLTFSAYLLHGTFLRNFMVMQTATYRVTVVVFTKKDNILFKRKSQTTDVTRIVMLTVSSFIAAFFFWILVEAPIGNIIRECFTNPEPIEGSKDDNDLKRKED